MNQRKYSFDEQDYPSKSKKKFGATAIALAIVSSLFMCMVGYEVVRGGINTDIPGAAITGTKKKSLIVSKPDAKSLGYLASANEGADDYQLLILKEQNKLQGSKIKALRQELMEKLQNAQEIKSSLFKYEGEAGDRSMIADMQRELTTKHQQSDQLKLKISALESDTNDLQKKITQLEVTRDTLMGMIDNVQSSNGYENAALKHQIAEIQNTAIAEKSDLEKKLQVLELTQQLLADALKQKSETIEKLEIDLVSNEQVVKDKSAELQLLLLQHSLSDEKTRKETLELVINIEFELTIHEIAKQKFLTALNDKAKLIAELEKDYVEQEKLGANREELLSGLENRANEHAREFILTLELEALRTQQMQLEHGQAVQAHLIQHQENEKKINDLEAALKLKESQMTPKELEMLSLVDLNYFNDKLTANQLDKVVSSHQVESINSAILDRQLQAARAKIAELEALQEELNYSSFASQQYNDQLSRQLAGKELLQADHELQLRLLVESHQNGKLNAGEDAQSLVDLIETERLHNQLLAAELAVAKNEAEVQKDLTALLGARLEGLAAESSYLEEALHGNKLAKADADQHINMIALKHSEEVDRSANLESELALAMQQLFDREAALLLMEDALKQKEREYALSQDAYKESKGKVEDTATLVGARLETLLLEANELEVALTASKLLLSQKDDELLTVKAQSEEQINQLAQTHAEESERATRLEYALVNTTQQLLDREADLIQLKDSLNLKEDDLAKLSEDHHDTRSKHEETSKILGARLEALLLEANELELSLNASKVLLDHKDAEITQIKDAHHASKSELEETAFVLGQRLDALLIEASELELSLNESRIVLENKDSEIAELKESHHYTKGKLEETANDLGQRLEDLLIEANFLEHALIASRLLLDDKESELAAIKADKEIAEQQLYDLKHNHSDEQYRSYHLEGDLETTLQLLHEKDAALAKLSEALDQRENELAQAKENHFELKDQLDASAELINLRIEELTLEANQLERELVISKSALEQREHELATLKAHKDEVEQQANLFKEHHANEFSRASNLENNLELTSQQLIENEAAIAKLKEALEQKEHELATLKAHKDDAEQQANIFKEHHANESNRASSLESNLEVTSQKLFENEAAIAKLKEALEQKEYELAILKAHKDDAEQQVNLFKEHHANESNRASTLESNLEIASKQLFENEAAIAKLKESLEQREHEIATFKAHKEDAEQQANLFREHHANEFSRASDLENNLELTSQRLSENETAIAKLKEALEQKEYDLATLKAHKDDAEQQANLYREHHANEFSRASDLENNLALTSQRLFENETAITKLKEALEQKEYDLAALKAHKDDAEQQANHYKEHHANEFSRASDLENNLALTSQRLFENEAAIAKLKEALEQKEYDLATLKAHKDDAELQANHYKEHHANEFNRASNLENHLELMSQKIFENESAITKLREALKQKESDYVQFHAHHREVKSDLEEMTNILSTRLENLADEASELEGALEVARSQLDYKDKLQSEAIHHLENDLVANLQKVIDLESALGELNDQLDDETKMRKQLQRQIANNAGIEGAHEENLYLKEHLSKLAEEAHKLEDALALERQEKHFIATELANAQYQLERLSKIVNSNDDNRSTADRN